MEYDSATIIFMGNIIIRCLWAGQKVDCAEIFTPVPTDYGMCCAFNPRTVLRQSLDCRIFSNKLNLNIAREEGCDKKGGHHYIEAN